MGEQISTCADCADLIEHERGDLPGLDAAALHIAVGALYGGWACDHVDWSYEDAAKAFEALWAQRGRWGGGECGRGRWWRARSGRG